MFTIETISVVKKPLQTGESFVARGAGISTVTEPTDEPGDSVVTIYPTATVHITSTLTGDITLTITSTSSEQEIVPTDTNVETVTETATATATGRNEEEPSEPPSDGGEDPNEEDPSEPSPDKKDELYSLIRQAIENAASMLRQHFINTGVWDAFVRHAEENRDRDENNDGNTPDGLAWLVRKRLGWPPKITNAEEPQYLDAALAVQKHASNVDIEEIVLKTYLDSLDTGNEIEETPPLDANSLFYISDMFTTNASEAAIAWEDFKKAAAWETDADYRPLILLKHIDIKPPIIPKASWAQLIQVYINKHIPYEQTWPLPSEMEQGLILELDVAFDSILQEIKRNAPFSSRYRGMWASDDETLEELRYILLYQNLTDPIFVEATDKEVEALKDEFLQDTDFINEIGGQGTLLSLFTDSGFFEGLKDHIRIAKINRQSLRDLAATLEVPILKGLIAGGHISDPKEGEDDNSAHNLLPKLERRVNTLTAEKNQHGSLEKDVNDGHRATHRKPFLSPKELRELCLHRCSFITELCAC